MCLTFRFTVGNVRLLDLACCKWQHRFEFVFVFNIRPIHVVTIGDILAPALFWWPVNNTRQISIKLLTMGILTAGVGNEKANCERLKLHWLETAITASITVSIHTVQ